MAWVTQLWTRTCSGSAMDQGSQSGGGGATPAKGDIPSGQILVNKNKTVNNVQVDYRRLPIRWERVLRPLTMAEINSVGSRTIPFRRRHDPATLSKYLVHAPSTKDQTAMVTMLTAELTAGAAATAPVGLPVGALTGTCARLRVSTDSGMYKCAQLTKQGTDAFLAFSEDTCCCPQ